VITRDHFTYINQVISGTCGVPQFLCICRLFIWEYSWSQWSNCSTILLVLSSKDGNTEPCLVDVVPKEQSH